MARRRRGSVLRKTDIAKVNPVAMNTVALFRQMTDDLDDLSDRIEHHGDDGRTLTARLLDALLLVIETPMDQEAVDIEARLKAIEIANAIRAGAHEAAAKQRMEFAKLAVEAQKTQNRLFLEERKLEAQQRMAEASSSGFDMSKLAEIAAKDD